MWGHNENIPILKGYLTKIILKRILVVGIKQERDESGGKEWNMRKKKEWVKT